MNTDKDPSAGTAEPGTGADRAPRYAPQVSSTGRIMPPDLSISVPVGRGATLPDGDYSRRKQSMRGFEDEYTDIVDYIVRITHRIWEDQDIGYIYDTYAPGCRVYDDSGPRHGIEEMVAGTIQSIAAFPAMRHYADDVIWAGDDEQGFVTSHRALNIGDHTGHWRWGPPTHRRLNTWVIANCVVKDNQIHEEWVLYNTAAKLQQLGLDVAACAREYGNSRALRPFTAPEITEVQRLEGGRKPSLLPEPDTGGVFDVEAWAHALFHNTYNRRDLSAIDRFYAPNVRWYGATNRQGYGRAQVRAMARGLLSTFPDLGVHVDEVYWMGNPDEGHRVSVRWAGAGTHKGYTLYGAPTGRQVHLWGISQLYLEHGRIVEEWALFNEFDVMAQLLRDEPAAML
ncbi:ester cyclase [Thermomonospora catenispora]|uniref:ester cyclase n=1 Tax=Thermomonospora catenispora TaxID=2493090 RepID=UPI0019D66DCF|nr:ester cyclase [Thermomonospora catenispora]